MSAGQPLEEKPLSYRGQPVVRAIGAVLLTACALMLILGMTVLSARLQGPRYLLYWCGCLLVAVAAMIVALWDMLLLRRASRQTRRSLFREQFMSGDLLDKPRKKDGGGNP
jgi:high-affinity Fe2+/Pb2+ permease